MLNSTPTGNKEAAVLPSTSADVPASHMVLSHTEAVGGDRDRELPNSIGATDLQPVSGILERRTMLTTGVFSSSDVQWNAVLSNYDPWTAWLSTPLVSSHLAGYDRLRGDLEVEVVVTSPPSSYGLYIVGAVSETPSGEGIPTTAYDVDGPLSDNPFTLSQDIHAMLDLSTSTTVRMKLPWTHPRDALSLTSTLAKQLPFWRVMIYPLSKMRSAGSTDAVTATYTLYARLLPGYSLSVATYQAKGPSRMARGAKYVGDQVSALHGTTKISGGLSKVGQAATMIGEAIPFLAPFAGPVAIGASAASKIASMFGFTRESTVETPDRVINRLFSPLSVLDGVDGSESLGMTSDPSVSIDPRIGGGIEGDPCTFEDLFSRWTLINSVTWAATDAPNTQLVAIPVSPGCCNETLGILYPSVGAYVGAPFRYWRGSMEYMIVVPSSPFHRGTLQVSWDPSQASTSGYDITNTQSNVIFDVDVVSQLCVRVSYVSEHPCKEMNLFGPSTLITGARMVRTANGKLSIRVQGGLRSSGDTTPVDVLVFARPGPDMRFGVPALTRLNKDGDDRTSAMWMLQAGGVADDAVPEVETVQLVGPGLDQYSTSAILWGEDVSSVRALMQKPSFWMKFDMPLPNYAFPGLAAFPLYPPPPYKYDPSEPRVVPTGWSVAEVSEQFTWFGWYAALFTGLRGSVRVKTISRNIVGDESSLTIARVQNELRKFVTCQPCCGRDILCIDPDAGPTVGTQCVPDMGAGVVPHAGLQNSSDGTSYGQEFLVPYYGLEKYISSRRVVPYTGERGLPAYDGFSDLPMFAVGQMTAFPYPDVTADPVLSIPPLAVFIGAGPDVAPVRFRRCPALAAPRLRSLDIPYTPS